MCSAPSCILYTKLPTFQHVGYRCHRSNPHILSLSWIFCNLLILSCMSTKPEQGHPFPKSTGLNHNLKNETFWRSEKVFYIFFPFNIYKLPSMSATGDVQEMYRYRKFISIWMEEWLQQIQCNILFTNFYGIIHKPSLYLALFSSLYYSRLFWNSSL